MKPKFYRVAFKKVPKGYKKCKFCKELNHFN